MEYAIAFKAYGHPNIKSEHKTTLMITRDTYLTPRGDCIVAIKAESGLTDLDERVVSAAKNEGANIILTLKVRDEEFKVAGKGHPDLTFKDPNDMVVRKSNFIDDRTIMINADKAACDIPLNMVKLLKDMNSTVSIRISVKP